MYLFVKQYRDDNYCRIIVKNSEAKKAIFHYSILSNFFAAAAT